MRSAMRLFAASLVSAMLALACLGCSGGEPTEGAPAQAEEAAGPSVESVSFSGLTLEVPSGWEKTEDHEDFIVWHANESGSAVLGIAVYPWDELSSDAGIGEATMDLLVSKDLIQDNVILDDMTYRKTDVHELPARMVEYDEQTEDDTTAHDVSLYVVTPDGIVTVLAKADESVREDMLPQLEGVLESVDTSDKVVDRLNAAKEGTEFSKDEIEEVNALAKRQIEEVRKGNKTWLDAEEVDDSQKADKKKDDAPATESTKQGSPTVSQVNALRKARDYLSFTNFSHDGLIDQLEFEQFSVEDATYAADNCGADWNEQALGKARDYLSFSAFSYDGLVNQLEYEKFTNEQATYGADNCGADWNEQAAKKASEYLSFTSFSRDGLIDQLVFEGFSYDQAAYGASSVGL